MRKLSTIRTILACNGAWQDDASVIWHGLSVWEWEHCAYHGRLLQAW